MTTATTCTCREPEPEPDPVYEFAVPLKSGFTFHERSCPVSVGAQLSPEARARVDAAVRENERARRHALAHMHGYVVG